MIQYDCRHFRASKPCAFNKLDGSECATCTHYSPYRERILFVKLDAIGDVLRSASLIPAIRARHDSPYIAWLTRKDSMELVSMIEHVDETIELSVDGLARAFAGGWDAVYSLSNDFPSASIATEASRKREPIGFFVRDGVMTPSNAAAQHWLEMGAFDRLKRENKQTYQRHMLDILGCRNEEIPPPALRIPEALRAEAAARVRALFGDSTRPRVAVNIGSGGRWPKKMLFPEQTYRYATLLREMEDVDVLLVGGRAEADKAAAILGMRKAGDRIEAALTEAAIPPFVALLQQTDALLCGDTLALHIATAIGLPTVAVFGPTNPAEIHTFEGLIHKTSALGLDCLICMGDCNKQVNCMSEIDLSQLAKMTIGCLAQRSPRSEYVMSGQADRQEV